MANHFEVQSTEKITPDFVNEHITEYAKKWLFDLFEVTYTHTPTGSNTYSHEHYWEVQAKCNDDYTFQFFFWINNEDNLEFRHSPKDDLIRWIENNWFEYIGKKVKNPSLYDEGIGHFGFENQVDKVNGYREYKENSIKEMSVTNKFAKIFTKLSSFKSLVKHIPEDLHIFFEDYKEKVQINFRNNNIDKVIDND